MAAPQQGNQNDNSAGILWGVAALFAFSAGIWYVFKDYIVTFYLYVKYYEASFLSSFSGTHFDPLKASILSTLSHPSKVTFAEFLSAGVGVGEWLRIPFVILLILMAVLVYLSNTARVFRNTYSMQKLASLEKANWPQITPVVNLNLLKTDIDKGPWAMAMTPMQFCKRYKLLEERRPQRREGMLRKEWDRIEVSLRRGEANKIFALQLGPLWRGVNQLPPHAKALFAAFAARINADTKSAEKLFAQLSLSTPKQLNLENVDALIKKHLNTKGVQKIIDTHAYVSTVMASMLEGAREDGVQASADFLWLKPMDRRLWYTLNTVGRQTPFAEVAGIFAHWVAEKEGGTKIFVPMVEEATNGLEVALKEVVYKPDD